MRKFTIRSGKFQGMHNIYDSVTEFEAFHPDTPFKEWGDITIQTNDWVRADDGYIVQCLHARAWRNKTHRSGQVTLLCRFPQGLFDVYLNAKGERRIRHFYAQFAKSQKNTLAQGKTRSIKKREFLLRVKAGEEIYKAYVATFRPRKRSKRELLYVINNLMIELEGEIMNIYGYLNAIDQEVLAKTGQDLKSVLITKTSELLLKDKSTKDELAVLKWIYDTLGKSLGIAENPKREIESAEFSVEAPLALVNGRSQNGHTKYNISRPKFRFAIIDNAGNVSDSEKRSDSGSLYHR